MNMYILKPPFGRGRTCRVGSAARAGDVREACGAGSLAAAGLWVGFWVACQESAGGTGRGASEAGRRGMRNEVEQHGRAVERSGACGPEAVWLEGWRQALERCGRETLGSRKPWKSLQLRGWADGRRGRGHQAPQARCLVEMSVLVVVGQTAVR